MPGHRAHHPRDFGHQAAVECEHDVHELVSDFLAAVENPSCRSFCFTLFDGRQGSMSAWACPHAPGSRPVVLIDDVTCTALQPWQSRSPIGEAVAHLAMDTPWLLQHRALLLVHHARGENADQHHFYEISPSVSHARIQGYGTSPLANPTIGYEAIQALLGPHRNLIDRQYPDLLPI